MTNDNQLTREEQIRLVEYQVCEKDNAGNFQGFWTLAAIFLGLSSVFLSGLIYAVIANKSLFSALLCHHEPLKTLVIGIIALIIGIANIVILKKLKGWHRRIMFNQGVNLGRMREIELDFKLVIHRGWQILAIEKWHQKWGDKEPTKYSKQVWQKLKCKLLEDKEIDPGKIAVLDALKDNPLVRVIQRYFPKEPGKARYHEYEPPSSQKHFPWILYTLMSLWVLVVATAVFLIIYAYTCLKCGLIAGGLILAGYIICLLTSHCKSKTNKEHNTCPDHLKS